MPPRVRPHVSLPTDRPRVLCVDDEAITLRLITRLLERMGMDVAPTTSPIDALRIFDAGGIDLVLTDVRMPGMDGLAFVRAVRARDLQVPVVVATGYATLETAIRALREGASGMIIKPFTGDEFVNEIRTVLEGARIRRDALQYAFVTPILDGVALALTAAIEARHLETGDHCRQLGGLGESVAELLGLDESDRTTIRIGGYLHDVGKIAIADAILLKPGRLTPEEYEEIKSHSAIGASIVSTHEGMTGIARIVRHHHERWDGAGYPHGLAGEAIPIGARIIAVADAFSAMTTDRVYRAALPLEEVWAELARHAGSQFDPAIVEIFPAAVERACATDPATCAAFTPALALAAG
jgi:putative two-component system response regulator